MLWRVRTTLPDRPGALASLAQRCGDAGVNILGLQIFPGVERVTDELVLRTPEGWGLAELASLVEGAGGHGVSAARCTESALVDQPTRYVEAARTVLAQPARFPEVVAGRFDAESDPVPGELAPVQDVMDMAVGDVAVQVRRTAPFTATEHARGASMAALVTDVLARAKAPAPLPGRRLGTGQVPGYVVVGEAVEAVVEGTVVGRARLLPTGGRAGAADRTGDDIDDDLGDDMEDGVRALSLQVDPAWQRRGIGTRLLVEAARLAGALGVTELVMTTEPDNQAVLPMVLAAGLRGRIRMAADVLTVRVPVRHLEPLRH